MQQFVIIFNIIVVIVYIFKCFVTTLTQFQSWFFWKSWCHILRCELGLNSSIATLNLITTIKSAWCCKLLAVHKIKNVMLTADLAFVTFTIVIISKYALQYVTYQLQKYALFMWQYVYVMVMLWWQSCQSARHKV